MQPKHFIICAIAVLLAFIGGFLLANSLNRAEIGQMESGRRSGVNDGNVNLTEEMKKTDLADDEIKESLTRAKNDAGNFMLQKSLGLALYQFAALKQDEKRLDDVDVLLQRAYSLNPDDYDVLVALGNINFDLAKVKRDSTRLNKARELFGKAMEKNPKDVRVLNSLSATYLEAQDPEPEKAIPYSLLALQIDRRNESAVQNAATAYLAIGQSAKAREFVSKLRDINKANPEINRLEGRIKMEEVK